MSIINKNDGVTYKNLLNDTAAVLDSATIDSLTITSLLDVTTATLVGIPNNLHATTAVEIDQINNINNVTISNAQWAHVGNMDQDVATTSDVQFNSATIGTLNLTNLELPGYLHVDTIDEYTAAAGVTIEGNLLKDTTITTDELKTDTVNEKTPAAGVTVDGVLLKDGTVTTDTILPGGTFQVTVGTSPGGLVSPGPIFTSFIQEASSGLELIAGLGEITLTSATTNVSGILKVDTITEKTLNNGVHIEGNILKDTGVATDQLTAVGTHISVDSPLTSNTLIQIDCNVEDTGFRDISFWKAFHDYIYPHTSNDIRIGSPPGSVIMAANTIVSSIFSLAADTIIPATTSGQISLGDATGGVLSNGSLTIAATKQLSTDTIDATTTNGQISLGNATGGVLSNGSLTIAATKQLSTDTIGSTTTNGQISLGNATGGVLSNGSLTIAATKQLSTDTIDATTTNGQITLGNATGGISSPGNIVVATSKKLTADTIDATTTNGQISLGNATGGVLSNGPITCQYIYAQTQHLLLSAFATSGFVQTSRAPYAYYRRQAVQSIPNVTPTLISWDTTTNQSFMSRTGTTITLGYGGIYTVSLAVNWTSAGTGRRLIDIQQNGTNITREENYENSGSPYMSQSCTISLYFNAGDTITASCYQDSGAAVNIGYGAGVSPYVYLTIIYQCN